VAAVKVVGIILAAAFLVIPAATARLLVRTFSAMTGVAMGIGVLTAIGGLLASYGLDVPSGATIILGQAVLFFAALIGTGR